MTCLLLILLLFVALLSLMLFFPWNMFVLTLRFPFYLILAFFLFLIVPVISSRLVLFAALLTVILRNVFHVSKVKPLTGLPHTAV